MLPRKSEAVGNRPRCEVRASEDLFQDNVGQLQQSMEKHNIVHTSNTTSQSQDSKSEPEDDSDSTEQHCMLGDKENSLKLTYGGSVDSPQTMHSQCSGAGMKARMPVSDLSDHWKREWNADSELPGIGGNRGQWHEDHSATGNNISHTDLAGNRHSGKERGCCERWQARSAPSTRDSSLHYNNTCTQWTDEEWSEDSSRGRNGIGREVDRHPNVLRKVSSRVVNCRGRQGGREKCAYSNCCVPITETEPVDLRVYPVVDRSPVEDSSWLVCEVCRNHFHCRNNDRQCPSKYSFEEKFYNSSLFSTSHPLPRQPSALRVGVYTAVQLGHYSYSLSC